jgi:FAD/FMN-containing dehydrogenase
MLSITLRYVKADHESFLPYAEKESIAFVLYINHGRDVASVEQAKLWTRKLIGAAQAHGGTYYLTYANYATPEQIRKSYPMLDAFFAKKRQYDPLGLFSNKFYENYVIE